MIDATQCVGTHNIVFITLDTLRYDVAEKALSNGETPTLASILPNGQWEKRHTPGNFTYAAHHAFFAGFLPTPIPPTHHSRLFAAKFPGSETTGQNTFVFDEADIVTGLAAQNYHTICIGGVGFFNKLTPLGSVLPSLFTESWWDESLGVTDMASTQNQIVLAIDRMNRLPEDQRLFLFINISACHQPNCGYVEGATKDTPDTQRAALGYVDSQLQPLFDTLQQKAPTLLIICADHGTAYGEGGFTGHRFSHPVTWEVPYMETLLPKKGAAK